MNNTPIHTIIDTPLTLSVIAGHCICASAATALGLDEELRTHCISALDNGADPLLCYELLLQSYLFAGFPAALEALSLYADILSHRDITIPFFKEEYDVEHFAQRGEVLCQRIYTTAYDSMRERFARITPDLNAWMLIEGYGKTLSRPGADIILRELCIIAMLIVLRRKNQLYSHIRGAKNIGVDYATLCTLLTMLDVSPVIHSHITDTMRDFFTVTLSNIFGHMQTA
jgi:4-carboxymuconolactone decarboxylase